MPKLLIFLLYTMPLRHGYIYYSITAKCPQNITGARIFRGESPNAYLYSYLMNCKRKRGKYPVGVSFDKGKYRAALNVDNKTVKIEMDKRDGKCCEQK